MSKRDGGAAFPRLDEFWARGLSVRQYYKAAALAGIVSRDGTLDVEKIRVAEAAADFADAMIAEDEAAGK